MDTKISAFLTIATKIEADVDQFTLDIGEPDHGLTIYLMALVAEGTPPASKASQVAVIAAKLAEEAKVLEAAALHRARVLGERAEFDHPELRVIAGGDTPRHNHRDAHDAPDDPADCPACWHSIEQAGTREGERV